MKKPVYEITPRDRQAAALILKAWREARGATLGDAARRLGLRYGEIAKITRFAKTPGLTVRAVRNGARPSSTTVVGCIGLRAEIAALPEAAPWTGADLIAWRESLALDVAAAADAACAELDYYRTAEAGPLAVPRVIQEGAQYFSRYGRPFGTHRSAPPVKRQHRTLEQITAGARKLARTLPPRDRTTPPDWREDPGLAAEIDRLRAAGMDWPEREGAPAAAFMLRQLCAWRGWTQAEAAHALGCSQSLVSLIQRETRPAPDWIAEIIRREAADIPAPALALPGGRFFAEWCEARHLDEAGAAVALGNVPLENIGTWKRADVLRPMVLWAMVEADMRPPK